MTKAEYVLIWMVCFWLLYVSLFPVPYRVRKTRRSRRRAWVEGMRKTFKEIVALFGRKQHG